MLGLLFTTLAYIAGSVIFYRFSLTRDFSRREAGLLLVAALVGGIFGAKISRLLFACLGGTDPVTVLAHPDGRTIIGGVIVGWMTIELAKKRLGIKRSTGDGFALALSCGEAVGRIGCFFNGCCYGVATTVPWAIYQAGAWRHPTQIYSALFALSTFSLLCGVRHKVKFEGDLFRIYLLLFGVGRFFLEFLRERTEIFFGLSIAQWVSVEITVAMIVAIGWSHKMYQQQAAKVGHDHQTV